MKLQDDARRFHHPHTPPTGVTQSQGEKQHNQMAWLDTYSIVVHNGVGRLHSGVHVKRGYVDVVVDVHCLVDGSSMVVLVYKLNRLKAKIHHARYCRRGRQG